MVYNWCMREAGEPGAPCWPVRVSQTEEWGEPGLFSEHSSNWEVT